MVFYAIGSLLFGSALICALAVTFVTFTQYRVQMVAALRTLSLDGVHGPKSTAITLSPSGLAVRARRALPDRRPARPAPHLAA
jgi:hypothetical protein